MSDHFVTRILNQADFADVEEVYRSATSWMGAHVPPEFVSHNLEVAKDQYLSRVFEKKLLLGTFVSGQLIMSGGLYFWKDMPFCTCLRLVTRASALNGRQIMAVLNSFYNGMLDEIERRGCSRFYVLTAVKHHKGMAYAGRANKRLANNYLMTVEEVIPANQQPKFGYTWNMMGSRTWPVDLVLRAGTALNHIRKIDYSIIERESVEVWLG